MIKGQARQPKGQPARQIDRQPHRSLKRSPRSISHSLAGPLRPTPAHFRPSSPHASPPPDYVIHTILLTIFKQCKIPNLYKKENFFFFYPV